MIAMLVSACIEQSYMSTPTNLYRGVWGKIIQFFF